MPTIQLSPEMLVLTGLVIGNDQQLEAVLARSCGPGSSLDWERLEWLACGNGVAGIAAARIEAMGARSAGRWTIPQATIAALHEHVASHLVLHMVQSAIAVRLSQRIEEAGGRAIVLKGLALAQQLYPEAPHLRGASDIDLLIAPEDLELADGVLRDAGFVRRWPEHLPTGKPGEIFMHLANAFDYVDRVSGQLVELHHRLTLNPAWIGASFDELHDASVPIQTAQGPIRGLTGPLQLQYLCWHAFAHTAFRLKWFGDIAGTLRLMGQGSAAALAGRSGAAPLPLALADALLETLAAALAGREGPALSPWLARHVARIVADMENPVDLASQRSLAGMPAELRFRLFLMRLSPGRAGKAYEVLRALSDPRDTAVLRLGRRFAPLYGLAGPLLALRRLALRDSAGAPPSH